MKYKVWECKIVVPEDSELPSDFDGPPRTAAIQAVLKETNIIDCFSGWGGSLTKDEKKALESVMSPPPSKGYLTGE